MIDGLRPDAIGHTNCPNMKALMARSAYTLSATSVMPSITLPCHTSIFHSVPPARHGITQNVWQPMARPLPGLFDLAHLHGLKSAMIHNWEPLRDLNRPETLDFSFFANRSYQLLDGDDLMAEQAALLIPKHNPDFAFVYLGTVDSSGHAYGWMSDGYFEQIERVDAALGAVLRALPAQSNIVLQADHGGHDRTHGTELPEDMTIPWLAAGPAIKQGHEIQTPVSLLDTAPTLARMLEIPPHPQWEGKVVEEIFAG
jgi:predicted AlkP superfamily pyrophosphatase or phosphodiesterase